MKCNIDSRGRRARFIWGVLMLVCAIVVAALTYFDILPTLIGWIGTGALLALGAFGIYESRKGWCVMRAMGVKTPM